MAPAPAGAATGQGCPPGFKETNVPLRVTVVTMEREVYDADDVERIIVPGSEGVMGILPRHEPILSALKEGELEIVRPGQRDTL
ncbi:MAG: hypothetical protein U0470_09065 [Anaerolineae bacterium]